MSTPTMTVAPLSSVHFRTLTKYEPGHSRASRNGDQSTGGDHGRGHTSLRERLQAVGEHTHDHGHPQQDEEVLAGHC